VNQDDRGYAAMSVVIVVLVLTAIANSITSPGTVPPVLTAVVPFIAAAFYGPRTTTLVAAVAIVEGTLLSYFNDGYTGVAFYSRLAMTVGSGILAIALAEMRVRREQEISTARHELQLAALLQAVVDSANDPIYAKDPSGRYLAANHATAATLGVDDVADLIGHRDREFVDAESASRIEADDRATLASGGHLEFDEAFGEQQRIFLTHKTVIHDSAGSVVGLSGVAKDVTVKRRAQRELERSEHRFRSLVEASSDIVWRTDRAGVFAEPQGGWFEYTGQRMEEMSGLQWLDAVHPDDRELIEQEWKQALSEGSFNESTGRLWHAASDGYRTMTIRFAPVADAEGEIIEWLCAGEDKHDHYVAEQRLRRIAEARAIVAEVASRGTVAQGVQAVAEAGLELLQERLPPHIGSVTLLDQDDQTRTSRFAISGVAGGLAGLPASVGTLDLPNNHIATDRRLLEFTDADDLVRAFPDARVLTNALGVDGNSFVVPLDMGARPMGALTLTFEEAVDDEVLDTIRLALPELAAVMSSSLLQADFHEREARIASTLQQSMLELAIEADPRLALSFHYQAGAEQMEAGGDWYDVVPLDDGRIALMVGDVVGRSLKAATVMGRLRGSCRALLLTTGDPAEVLSNLDSLAQTIEGASFSTCCCVVLDPAAQTATYSSAGHPPGLLLSADGEPSFLWDAQGPPLAIPTEARPSATVPFPTGSRLFLYSDGLVERRGEVIDIGLDRLAAAAMAGRHLGVDDECDRIATALFDDFSQNDDVAIVCVETVSESSDAFERRLGPDTTVLHRLRRDMRVWLSGHGVAPNRSQEIVPAIGEALANAAEHSGPSDSGVTLEVRRLDRKQIAAAVADDGSWRHNVPDPTRGRGLAIISSIAESVEVEQSERGTRVQMCFAI
jgi:PAS domain S-box-containing protein